MKKVNYVDYFKIFENKKKGSIVISIGEYHEFYSCGDEKSLDVNNIIGDIFSFYKNKINNAVKLHKIKKKEILNKINLHLKKDESINLLIEMDILRCADLYEPSDYKTADGDLMQVYESNLFQVCHELLMNKKKWKWTPVDPRGNMLFLKTLSDITKTLNVYNKYITEIEVYNYVDDLIIYSDDIYRFLEDYDDDNYFKRQIISSFNKIKQLYKNCTNPKYFKIKPIGHLVGNLMTGFQDIYTHANLKNNKINILFTGSAHNKNMEPFFRKNGYTQLYTGDGFNYPNCMLIDINKINDILLKFYFNKISIINNLLISYKKNTGHV
jgi:hypothetical protein